MIRFLLQRRIAVLMSFLALVILGCVTFVTLPVSLLPDVDVPRIAVRADGASLDARELENMVVAPLRRELMQVGGLSDIRSETRDGYGIIRLTMDYGVDTDLAFIEVNEKIDAAMNSLPRDISRPKAVKASVADIPVTYLQLTAASGPTPGFYDVADNIVRRRLEQLPEVALVDISGVPGKELRVTPDYDRMHSAGITLADVEKALKDNNAEPGSMTVRDGYYEYSIHISGKLRTSEDVENVPLMKNGRMHRLGDFCEVELAECQAQGYSLFNGHRAVTMAVIKNEASGMADLDKAIYNTIEYFSSQYPDISITKTRSQTELLDFTISNLRQNLILGLVLVFLVCALFMRNWRMPVVIGFTVVVAVIITFLLFYLFHISINIISLAGLILAVGMMIDNSVIVAENIMQYRKRGYSLEDSCVAGTTEMITPMLSSSLTTVAIFLPLVFMSGIAGAIFADQAFSITAGLFSSYATGITLLPVLVSIVEKGRKKDISQTEADFVEERGSGWYDKGIDFIFSHKSATILFVILVIASLFPLAKALDVERLPRIDSTETILSVNWNENINVDENRVRSEKVAGAIDNEEWAAFVGRQDFMLGDNSEKGASETEFYFRVSDSDKLQAFKDSLTSFLRREYPAAVCGFSVPSNPFEQVFSSGEAPLEARFMTGYAGGSVEKAARLCRAVEGATGLHVKDIPRQEVTDIRMDPERMLLYGVSASDVRNTIDVAFKGSQTTILRSYQDYIPVRISDRGITPDELLATELVSSSAGKDGSRSGIPLSALAHAVKRDVPGVINASGAGEYLPVELNVEAGETDAVIEKLKEVAMAEEMADVAFTGSIFSNRKMMKELTVILLVSLLMMYFILCAQFESFVQPLIVLLEIPVDVSFALLTLLVCGETLNLMSAIGIIVTCGIVVNDSILKLDSINELRRQGMPLAEAVHTAGKRRLKPILMTSLTTIFAMLPVLFTSDMGSELQRPLAVAMIGSMAVGTLVSIFVIPLVYYLIYNPRHLKKGGNKE